MKRIYSAQSIIDAQLLCDQLLDQDIKAVIKGSYLTGAIGELPPDQLVSVWIVDDDLEPYARQHVMQFEKDKNVPRQTQVCSHCDELNDGCFRICWSCQQPLV